MGVPSLESLALKALADALHTHEPDELHCLPFGGGAELMRHLVEAGRLRPETLRPLLADWSSQDKLKDALGSRLGGAAGACRGLGALAVQRLNFQHRQRQHQGHLSEQPQQQRELDEVIMRR